MNARYFAPAVLLFIGTLFAAERKVIVEAGPEAYSGAVCVAEAPAGFPARGILSGGGEEIPFQKNLHGEIVFVLPRLEANGRREFAVREGGAERAIRAERREGKVRVTAAGKDVFTYQGQPSELPREDIKAAYQRGGYIHPVVTPGGRLVTDDYPPNHIHHHGIWFPWTKTEFEGRTPDFWNMGKETGTVEFERFGETWSGPVHAGFTARHRFIDLTAPEPKAALDETWEVTAYAIPGADYWVFDLVSTQSCATESPLRLPKYYYGGLGYRGHRSWNGREECEFLTSAGETDRVKGNATRGKWCHIGGEVEGGFAGTAILCHPDNFRAPQPMRLHPSEPFFCFAPGQLGDWEIAPGKPYISRYRFIVNDGKPDKAELDRLWRQYARPPKVWIE